MSIVNPFIKYILQLQKDIVIPKDYNDMLQTFYNYQQTSRSSIPYTQQREKILRFNDQIINLSLDLLAFFCADIFRSEHLCRALVRRSSEDYQRVIDYGFSPQQLNLFYKLYQSLTSDECDIIAKRVSKYVLCDSVNFVSSLLLITTSNTIAFLN